jgi:hypothetical protein
MYQWTLFQGSDEGHLETHDEGEENRRDGDMIQDVAARVLGKHIAAGLNGTPLTVEVQVNDTRSARKIRLSAEITSVEPATD